MKLREALIVALDVPNGSAARDIVAAVGDSASTYKVGMQLFTAAGPALVREVILSGKKVFLDLKYHDIPNTVSCAVKEAAGHGVHMVTLHAMGGAKMLRTAVESARAAGAMKVLAVTVLTSMADRDLPPIGIPGKISDQVMKLAALAFSEGCDGVIASALEAAELRRQFGAGFMIVTPGVRPRGSEVGDQARVVTPSEAIMAGASHIVVGRPIIAAADPAQVVRDILAEIEEARLAADYSFS